MKKRILFASAIILVAAAAVVVLSQNRRQIREFLTGYEEVPSVSTQAGAEFHARINRDETQITYEETYRDLEALVTQSHIHFGQPGVNGSIEMWLCGNPERLPAPPPAGTQRCPDPPPGGTATITGTLTADNVTGQTLNGLNGGQGIQPGEFAEIIRAMKAGKTYVNIHSQKFPGGEVRSQINTGGDGHDHQDGDHDGDDH
jgi:CHRD domain